jgi:maltoporin
MSRRGHILLCVCAIFASLSSWSRNAVGIEPPSAPTPSTPVPQPGPSQPPAQVPPISAEGTGREPGSPAAPTAGATGFDFGAYGRVGVGLDLRGHEGYSTNVVSHGSRLEEAPYIEPDFYYTRTIGGDPDKRWRVVLAPAFAGGDLFHYSGSLDSHFVIRNAYVETENLGAHGLRLWAGSRMYRGDDIYLFDYWPMDNLNTVGAGASYRARKTEVALQVGLNRLDDLYQFERLDTPPRGLGPPGSATVLDRPRFVASVKATQQFGDFPGAKVSIYGEVHALPSGEQTDPTTMMKTPLPGDVGWVAGLQLGGWLRPYVFLNLWLRAAGGLAAFGELSVPTGIDPTRRVTSAREIVGAMSGNWESRWLGVMFGAYVRRFNDASASDLNPASYTEGILAARPHIYWNQYFHTAVELSYQARQADSIDFVANRVLTPQVFRFSVLPLVAPLGRGTYSRPQIYLVYTVSVLNDDARIALWDPQDFRYQANVVHYLGTGVEWWFNSSYR